MAPGPSPVRWPQCAGKTTLMRTILYCFRPRGELTSSARSACDAARARAARLGYLRRTSAHSRSPVEGTSCAGLVDQEPESRRARLCLWSAAVVRDLSAPPRRSPAAAKSRLCARASRPAALLLDEPFEGIARRRAPNREGNRACGTGFPSCFQIDTCTRSISRPLYSSNAASFRSVANARREVRQ